MVDPVDLKGGRNICVAGSDANGADGIKRGDIYMARLPGSIGAAKDGARPVLIIQNDVGNRFSPDVIAACVTSNISSRSYPVNVRIPDGLLPKESVVRLSQIITMKKSSLGKMIARMPNGAMDEVDEALRLSLGLPKLE